MVSQGKRPPSLTAVIVGDDKASQIYVRNKMNAAERCGLHANIIQRDSSLRQDELIEIMDQLGRDDQVYIAIPDNTHTHTHTHTQTHYDVLGGWYISSIASTTTHSREDNM